MRPTFVRAIASLIVFIFLFSGVAGFTSAQHTGTGGPTVSVVKSAGDIVLVSSLQLSGSEIAAKMKSLMVPVLETYDIFVLASVTEDQRAPIQGAGMEITDLPYRTMTGRGDFVFDTRLGEPTIPTELKMDLSKNPNYNTYIVQFIGPIKQEWMITVESFAVDLLTYLPSYSFISTMSPAAKNAIEKLPFVQWVGVYQPAYKISHGLLSGASAPEGTVKLLPGMDSGVVVNTLALLGGKSLGKWVSDSAATVKTRLTPQVVAQLAKLPEVSWIEEQTAYQLYNNNATWVVQTDIPGNRAISDHGVTGAGQIVTMADSGLDYNHEMFYDNYVINPGPDNRKIVDYYVPEGAAGNFIDDTDHGTHVAGTIAGDAAPWGTYNGFDGHAYGARIIVQDIDNVPLGHVYPPNDFADMFAPSYAAGSRIHTNSWGMNINAYGSDSETIDQFMWEHPDYLILYAAGNSGPGLGTVNVEGNSKNIVTVGASGNGYLANNMAYFTGYGYFSSRGPAADGRMKPTVIAPGGDVWSAKMGTSSGYMNLSGTSMATPDVAGNAALIRQYFMDGYYPSGAKNAPDGLSPSAALVKATLINGADEITDADAYGQTPAGPYSFITLSNQIKLSSPFSLGATPYSDHRAQAMSKEVDFDYSTDYVLNLNFYLTPGLQNGMQLLDDGRAYAWMRWDNVAGEVLQILGSNTNVMVPSVSHGVWHNLRVNYHPTMGTFDALLDGTTVASGLAFIGDPTKQLVIGTGSARNKAGQVFFDDISYKSASESQTYFSDNFDDGDISDWTITADVNFSTEFRYPNDHQGWGRINLDNVLYFTGDPRRLLVVDDKNGFTASGQMKQYKVNIADATKPFEATLVWTDYPGAPAAQKELVNDLDLLVTDPSGNQYKGNVYAGYNPGQSVTGGSYDNTNVEESVLRLAPAVGEWTITVTSKNVVYGPQPFALVMTTDKNAASAIWTDSFDDGILHWTKTGSGTVELSSVRYHTAALSLHINFPAGVLTRATSPQVLCNFSRDYSSVFWFNTVSNKNLVVYDDGRLEIQDNSGTLSAVTASGGAVTIGTLTNNAWHKMEIRAHPAPGSTNFEILIDGVSKGTYAMKSPTSTTKTISLGSKTTVKKTDLGEAYWDDFVVYGTPSLSAPQNLHATRGDTRLTLAWDRPAAAGGAPIMSYKIYRGLASNSEVYLTSQGGTLLTWTDTGLTNGVKYYYKVSAVTAAGEGPLSNEISATPTPLPSAPMNLAATRYNGSVLLTWTAPSSDGGSPLTSYSIYRSTVSGSEIQIVSIGASNLSYNDTLLLNGQLYFFKVTAVNVNGEGLASSEVSATPASRPWAPTNLVAAPGDGVIYLSWNKPEDGGSQITAYNIYRSLTPGGEGLLVQKNARSGTVYSDTQVWNDFRYYYTVTAGNALGEGPASNEASALPFPVQFSDNFDDGSISDWWVQTAPGPGGGSKVGLNSTVFDSPPYSLYCANSETIVGRATSPSIDWNVKARYNISLNFNGTYTRHTVILDDSRLKLFESVGTIFTYDSIGLPLGIMPLPYAAWTHIEVAADPANSSFRLTVNGVDQGTFGFYDSGTATNLSVGSEVVPVAKELGAGFWDDIVIHGSTKIKPPTTTQFYPGSGLVSVYWASPASNGGAPLAGYKIYRATVPGQETYYASTPNLYYMDYGVTDGVTYYYELTAVNVNGDESARTAEMSATPVGPPSPPQNLQATAGNTQVTLSWSPAANDNGAPVTSYTVYRGSSSGTEQQLAAGIVALSYLDTSVANNVTYWYYVTAVNSLGGSLPSNEVSAKPTGPPYPPVNLVTKPGNTQVVLTWAPPSNDGGSKVLGYDICRGTTPGSEIWVHSVGPSTLTYTDTGLTNGQIYYYVVKAYSNLGGSQPSNEALAKPANLPGPVPNLKATAGTGKITLTWSAAPDGGSTITLYKIYRATRSGQESLYATVSGTVLTYVDTGVSAGKTYYYQVSAVNAIGEGPHVTEVSATVPR